MAQTEAAKRATIKYEKENTVQLKMKLNRKTDADILECLQAIGAAGGSKQGFIKEAIREKMKSAE